MRKVVLTAVVTAAAIVLSSSALAGKGHKHGKHNKKAKPRMSVCHFQDNGELKLKSLPLRAAVRHLHNHENDMEPVIGEDGVETCETVEPPRTTCLMDVNGVPTSISEFIASQNVPGVVFNTDSDSCDLKNADMFFFLQSGPNLRLLITSQEQYNDCAFDLETAGAAQDTCPEVVNPDF